MSAPLVDARDVPGWYGKLSSLGDFAHRRLAPDWLRTCDAWLSNVMRAGREDLGDRWLDVYLTAPVLRFGWAPGVVDRQWWFGLLMPSCDSVGRYFPLLIAHPRAQAPQDRIALDHLERWLDHLAAAATHTLSETQGSVDALEAALAEAPPWPTAGRAAAGTQDGPGRLRLGRSAPLSQWIHALALQELQARLGGCSVWWRLTEGGAQDTLEIVHGLPDGRAFAKLLAGQAAG